MKLSIVTTLFNSEKYIKDFHQRASAVAQKLVDDDFEIIFVNDGSPDRSLEVAVKLTTSHQNVTVIDLSRNFGHHKAMMTGLNYASGELVFLIDSDLEEEPEWLIDFNNQMKKDQCDMIYGVQDNRRGAILERITGSLFYKLFRLLTQINQPDNIVTARLMTRRYVKALISHEEREINIGGLWITTGFKQTNRIVSKHSSSRTSYSFGRKLGHLVNAITSFSSLPLVFIFYSGLFISFTSIIYILYLCLRYIFLSQAPSGYTSLISSIWLFSGLIIFFIGVQGIYLSKIFSEVKRRPNTIVRKIYKEFTKKA